MYAIDRSIGQPINQPSTTIIHESFIYLLNQPTNKSTTKAFVWMYVCMQVVTGSNIQTKSMAEKKANVGKQQTVQLTIQTRSAKAKALLLSRKESFPDGHPAIGSAMVNLANNYAFDKRYEDALEMYNKSLTFFEKVLPKDHPKIGTLLFNMAYQCIELGMHDKALRLGTQSLNLFKKSLPENDELIGRAMNNLASTYASLGRREEALNLLKQLLPFYERILPPGDPKIDNVLTSINNLTRKSNANPKPKTWG